MTSLIPLIIIFIEPSKCFGYMRNSRTYPAVQNPNSSQWTHGKIPKNPNNPNQIKPTGPAIVTKDKESVILFLFTYCHL